MGFACFDTHRRLRRGFPEAVFCEGKTPDQIVQIAKRLILLKESLLLTRLKPESAFYIQKKIPAISYHPVARLGYWLPKKHVVKKGLAPVVSAGTADIPVAEEAALTLEFLGSRSERIYDIGVAGIHRILDALPMLQRAKVAVVVAGMEGALPSVIAGLISCPVIAVPTSTGYGANFGGIAPLLSMMNSCAPGVGVVNIDNGFGAGYLAHLINTVRR
jgi:hypothetical protein